jgi:hypothetical protein
MCSFKFWPNKKKCIKTKGKYFRKRKEKECPLILIATHGHREFLLYKNGHKMAILKVSIEKDGSKTWDTTHTPRSFYAYYQRYRDQEDFRVISPEYIDNIETFLHKEKTIQDTNTT